VYVDFYVAEVKVNESLPLLVSNLNSLYYGNIKTVAFTVFEASTAYDNGPRSTNCYG
jgi:hypothetical protein